MGSYLSNSLKLGNGNNVVYYDSSLRTVQSGSGHNVFIPSFGSFNWSIDWLQADQFGATETQTFAGTYQDLPGSRFDKPLISPVPWEKTSPNPSGEGGSLNYVERSASVADSTASNRTQVGSQGNLYTVNAQQNNGQNGGPPRYLKSFFNGKILQGADPYSYNPVNQIGGITLKSNIDPLKNVGLEANGGNNTFYGMDWRLYEHLLPTVSVTTANQLPDKALNKRGAFNAWQTVNMYGGPGNNYFFLGDVVDDITNNGVFYDGQWSYILSLTHDRRYLPNELNRSDYSRFGNAVSRDGQKTLSSVVNLTLQADPTTLRVITQKADSGSPGTNTIQQAGAWNGLANAVNKAQGNGEKAISSYANWLKKGQASKLLSLAQFASKAVPWVDFAVSAVSAAIGLINLFKTEPQKPPQQEITATYTSQGLNPSQKAVLINDWHPYTRINIDLPGTNPNAWDTLGFNIKSQPLAVRSTNRKAPTLN